MRLEKRYQLQKELSPLSCAICLPDLLEEIGRVMLRFNNTEEFLKNEKFEEIVQKSLDHGRHRAAASQYTVGQVTREYICLNRVLIEPLISEGFFDTEVSVVITFSLETSMSYSIIAFSDALQEMREKLVGTLAHDVRNPISAAYFSLDVMKKVRSDEQKFEKAGTMAKESLKRSLDLLEGLVNSIRIKAGEGITLNFQRSDIIEQIKKVREEADQVYSNKIELKSETDNLEMVFDSTAIRRSLENLLTNAVKNSSLDDTISIAVAQNEDQVILKVHNSGNPILLEDQKMISDFFRQSSQNPPLKTQSWGMGLAFVKMAAEAHGGHVEMESNEESGTTFSVILNRHSNSPRKGAGRIKLLNTNEKSKESNS